MLIHTILIQNQLFITFYAAFYGQDTGYLV